ncbi:MAG: hypothetical protein OHK0045_25400 [Raineya sp.]
MGFGSIGGGGNNFTLPDYSLSPITYPRYFNGWEVKEISFFQEIPPHSNAILFLGYPPSKSEAIPLEISASIYEAIPLEISVSIYDVSLNIWLFHKDWFIYTNKSGSYLSLLNPTTQSIAIAGTLKYFFGTRGIL